MAALAARRRKGGTRFVPPKTAEDAVPVRRIWPDGVCLTDDGEYAKTWRVSDVNYAAASKEDKEAMFLGYSALLNSFDSDARAKVTVAVRRLDAEALGRRILIPPKGDGLDRYREEYNAMLMEKATGANSMVREIYLTIAVGGRSIQEAPLLLQPRVGGDGRAPRAPRGALRGARRRGQAAASEGLLPGRRRRPAHRRARLDAPGALVQGRRCARGRGH